MKVPGLRHSAEMVGGLVFFGRSLDKIRLHAQGKLPADYLDNLGKGMDARVARLLHVDYEKLKTRTLEGGTDEEYIEWCFKNGHRPSNDEIEVWNGFMSKRGWRDAASEMLAEIKKKNGLAHRDDIQTFFDLHKVDEA